MYLLYVVMRVHLEKSELYFSREKYCQCIIEHCSCQLFIVCFF